MKKITKATGNYNCHEIESITYATVCQWLQDGMAEKFFINDHECFIVDFEGYFGYSILVFRNQHIMKHVGDYQLHHHGMSEEELKTHYLNLMHKRLFTDKQFFSPCADYDDYKRKMNFAINHWVSQFGSVSAFYVGEPNEEQKRAMETMFFDYHGMCYVPEPSIVERHGKMMDFLKSELERLQDDMNMFRSMVRYELRNHEACYSHEWDSALASLGLAYSELSPQKQQIVRDLMWAEEMRSDI